MACQLSTAAEQEGQAPLGQSGSEAAVTIMGVEAFQEGTAEPRLGGDMQRGLEVSGEVHYNLGRAWVGTSWGLGQCLEVLGMGFTFSW